jgi:hypothetical protein
MAGEGGGAGTVGELDAVTAWLAAQDISGLAGDQLAAAVLGTVRLVNAAFAFEAALLTRFHHDGRWSADGALSAAQWVAQRSGTSPAVLRGLLAQGEVLRRLPAVAGRARAGRLSAEHVQALCECTERRASLAAENEQLLLERAESLDADTFRLAVRRWLHAADTPSADAGSPCPPAAEPPAPAGQALPAVAPVVTALAGLAPSGTGATAPVVTSAGTTPADTALAARATADAVSEPRSHLHASRLIDGSLRLFGWFVPADADLLEAVLGAGVERQLRAAADGDPTVAGRPVPALRAGALLDLAAQAMRHEPSDQSAPDRYRVAVIVRPGERTDPPEAACDHTVAYRAAVDAKGEVLDIGRQSARWPPGIRRAITLRDRGCIFPGCDRPPAWADIHHCTPFSQEGTTSVDNGALLCRRHHTFIHARTWRVAIEHGKPVVRRPDGQPHTIRRWHVPHGDAGSDTRDHPPDFPPPAPEIVERE